MAQPHQPAPQLAPAAPAFVPDQPSRPLILGPPPAVPPYAGTPDPARTALQTAEYQGQIAAGLEVWKQQQTIDTAWRALNASRADADRATEVASVKAIQDAYIATVQSTVERSLTRVNVATGAVGAVITLYTGLLALAYTSDVSKGSQPLNGAVALIPGLYLGLALFLITIYAAMLRKKSEPLNPLPTGLGGDVATIRLATYVNWTIKPLLNRAWAMNSGIVALGVGVTTLPLPFVGLDPVWNWLIFGAGAAATTTMALVTLLRKSQDIFGNPVS